MTFENEVIYICTYLITERSLFLVCHFAPPFACCTMVAPNSDPVAAIAGSQVTCLRYHEYTFRILLNGCPGRCSCSCFRSCRTSGYNITHIDMLRRPGSRIRLLCVTRHPPSKRTIQIPALQRGNGCSHSRFVQAPSCALTQLISPRKHAYDKNRMPTKPSGLR